ncbi:clan AA aspartic protease [Candidatus Gracilibacteria bacterium]|nr:clan AA aspartic protease [Candidatus Gracilibacteria bacterium]NJM88733.1 clan AA aspartic protease [Hydrococcus sp. RU_2_2]NJP21094.1 clan AA aspartic protease [Hydrococcus sp. CRU_1_1]
MMFGVVNRNCEATIKVAVGRIGSPKVTVDAVIDTGFTSFLSLPLSIIADLGLPWHYRDVGTLGDGSEVVFEIYKAAVIWDGQNQIIDVAASEADPLVGMSLLYGFKVQIEAVEGGTVTIEALK